MASRSSAHHWEAPKFSFNSPNQAAEWQAFYTRALDFLEALDIDPEKADENKCGWRQIKMMFEGEDRQALQTLIDNKTVTSVAQQTPVQALQAIQTVIKEDVHFWHHSDQLLSDFCQLPEEGVHALGNRICTIIAKCQISSQEIKDFMKLITLQHAVKYHEARDWIRLQDQSTVTYNSLLAHCTQLEARCEQYQQAKAQGRAHLTSMASASASKPFINHDLQSYTKQPCDRCGYNHPHGHCPAFHKKCYNCSNTGHFTALCRKPRSARGQTTMPFRCREVRGRSPRSTSRSRRSTSRSSSRSLSRSPNRNRQTYRSSSRHSSRSPSQDHHRRRSPRRRRRSPTPHRHQVSHVISFHPTTTYDEGQLYTDRAPDGHTSFHTTLQMVTKQGCKPLPVKVDPGADINTIPLTRYKTIFPQHFTKDGHLKKNTLRSTASTWSPHDGQRKHFLGFFTIDIQHKTLPTLIPLSFYVFQDSTSPHLLLSYSASIHLGIVEFKIPNEAKTNATVSSVTNTRPNKTVSFKDPLSCSTPTEAISATPIPQKSILKRKTQKNKSFQDHHNYNTTEDYTAQIHTEKQLFQDHPAQILQENTRKCSFQDHPSKVKCHYNNKHVSQDPVAKYSKIQPSQDPSAQTSKKQLLQDHTTKSVKNQSFQDHSAKSSIKQPFQDHNATVKDVRYYIPQICIPPIFRHYRQYAWGVYHLPRPFCPPSSTCSSQGPHRMQRSH